MKKLVPLCLTLFALFGGQQPSYACTSLLVSKGASADGSVMITYAADSHTRYGSIIYHPAATYAPGSMLNIFYWGNGKPLGSIPQVSQTYSVMGFMNEHQVAMGETTFDGRPELQDTTGTIDYGSLMVIALQRSKSAREAIKVMAELVDRHGYYSTGESFSISDANEAWIMEIIGKGAPIVDKNGKPVKGWTKGAVWVAMRIPDGYISAHANQARITQFPLEKRDCFVSISSKNLHNIFHPEVECVYAHDVISFARLKGYFDGKDDAFSFSDTYAPLDFGAARFSEARVWSIFRKATDGMDQYLDYALGKNLKNRMPLWIKPNRKIGLGDVKEMMRDHYEGTPMDMTKDMGGGPFNAPYRWRPMTWELNGEPYIHERAISTQQTGFSFVAQSRSWLPNVVGGLYWFGVDDTYSTVYTPVYSSGLSAPHCFDHHNGSMCDYSETSAFWLFNQVANFAYSRYNSMIIDIQKVQKELEDDLISNLVPREDKIILELIAKGISEEEIKSALTLHTDCTAERVFDRWKKLSQYLLVKYIDGNIKKEDENGNFLQSPYRPGQNVAPHQPRYPDWWYEAIIRQHGNVIQGK